MYDPEEALIARVNEILAESSEEDEQQRKHAARPKVNGAKPGLRPATVPKEKEPPILVRIIAATEKKRRWYGVLGVAEGEVTRS